VLVALGQVGNTVSPLMGTAVVVITILAFLPVIAMNIYSAKLTTLTCVDSIKHIEPTRKARILAIAFVILLQLGVALSIQSSGKGLSVLGIYLVVMLYFLVPWTSVNLTDYFFVRKGRYAIPHFFMPHGNIYGSWGLRGIAAYAIGFISMIPFFYIFDGVEQREVYVGPLAKALGSIDIAWLVGLIVSGVAYYVLSRSIDLKREEAVIQHIEKISPQFTTGDIDQTVEARFQRIDGPEINHGYAKIRLHHHRRRLGRLCVGQPPERRPGHLGAGPGIWRQRQERSDPDAQRILDPDEHQEVQLALRNRAGNLPQRSSRPLPSGQGAGWFVVDQRPGVHPRSCL
jgi:hypothetical protein